MTKIGMVTDSLGHLSFLQMLDTAAVMGISGVEANAYNWTSAPHFQLATMLEQSHLRLRHILRW